MLAFIVRLKTRALFAAAVAVLITGGAAAAGTTPPPASSAVPGTVASAGLHQVPPGPHGAHGLLSAARAASAAQTCAASATAAGWADNGSLVTASAVCVAESGGQASVYYCDATGKDGDYPPVDCSGIYDRGLWQLDSAGQSETTDACAFTAQCNADAAYGVSDRGTNFAPWAVYNSGDYTRYVADAQEAVGALASGTVTGGVLGACLARGQYAVNAPVVIGSCGSGAGQQQWSAVDGTIRSAQLCIAPASTIAGAGVRLRRCDGLTWQQWAQPAAGQLRNALTGECLSDPGGSLVPGTQVTIAPCAANPARTWWLP
jgi:hypothetical protein